MFFLADGDMAVLTEKGVQLCDFDGRPVKRQVQHVPVCRRARPHPDVAVPRDVVEALGKEVPCEDPLHRVVRSDVKSHPDRVWIVSPVIQACGERNSTMFGDDEPQPKLRCDDGAGIHYRLNLCFVRPRLPRGTVVQHYCAGSG